MEIEIPAGWRIVYNKKTNIWKLQRRAFIFIWFTVRHIDPQHGDVPMTFASRDEAARALVFQSNIYWKNY